MAREAWERTITDSAGNVQTGVQVSVFQSDGSTVATIYGQQSGGAPIANPFNTGVQTSAKFYADPGRYVVRVLKDGLTKEFTDVSIADKAIRDDLGTAAYLTATGGTSDTTPGRVMRVGDFGNGGFLDLRPVYTNFDTPQKCWGKGTIRGFIDGAALGIAGVGFGVLEINGHYVDASGGPSVYQRFTYGGITFARSQTGPTSWTAWDVVGASVLGPVGFANGLSSGAIIERGTNANGEYTKFADGTVKAWGRVIATGQTLNPATSPNPGTGYLCDPVMPVVMLGPVVSLCQRAIYDASDRLIYSVESAATAGLPIIMNLGMRPDASNPYLNVLGTSVAVKVDYSWTAVGRWR